MQYMHTSLLSIVAALQAFLIAQQREVHTGFENLFNDVGLQDQVVALQDARLDVLNERVDLLFSQLDDDDDSLTKAGWKAPCDDASWTETTENCSARATLIGVVLVCNGKEAPEELAKLVDHWTWTEVRLCGPWRPPDDAAPQDGLSE
jgi:hypothetical protein